MPTTCHIHLPWPAPFLARFAYDMLWVEIALMLRAGTGHRACFGFWVLARTRTQDFDRASQFLRNCILIYL